MATPLTANASINSLSTIRVVFVAFGLINGLSLITVTSWPATAATASAKSVVVVNPTDALMPDSTIVL